MIVATTAGKVQGVERGGVLQFRAVPFARAERFRPPEPVEPWAGVREATRFGPMAPQNKAPLESMIGGQDVPGEEDCLVLNVFTPALDDGARPVMVWVHGGGFVSGSGHVPWYDGSNLVRGGDVVVVSINYRLGALGFLELGHLDAALAGSGANGLRDQIAALRWVQDNVAAFGGDPGNVTIFGESAGAMSIGALLAVPEATGLFHKAILQSGAASNVQRPDIAAWVTGEFLDAMRLSPGSPGGLEGLLGLPVDEVLRVQGVVETEILRGEAPVVRAAGGILAFQPTVDGSLLDGHPLTGIRAGSAAGKPLVIGTNADEWNLFHLRIRQTGPLDEARARRRLGTVVGEDRVSDVLDAYRAARPTADVDGLVCAVMTDRVFRVPAIRLAEAQLPHAPRVSMYRWDLGSTAFGGLLGACHAVEVPFVLGNLSRTGVDVLIGGLDEGAHAISATSVLAWTKVARTGDPGHEGLSWPAYDLATRSTVVLDRSPTNVDDPDGELRRLWDEIDGSERPDGATPAAPGVPGAV
ncbi:MAG TPA: carboxylesterase/lipase family protein [Acidimicrobiales bacterium]|nr:carboxylesterase/lipase family protein [Acidimicrobiales bacterium]